MVKDSSSNGGRGDSFGDSFVVVMVIVIAIAENDYQYQKRLCFSSHSKQLIVRPT